MKSIKELFAQELKEALARQAVNKSQGLTPCKKSRVIPATSEAVVVKIVRPKCVR